MELIAVTRKDGNELIAQYWVGDASRGEYQQAGVLRMAGLRFLNRFLRCACKGDERQPGLNFWQKG